MYRLKVIYQLSTERKYNISNTYSDKSIIYQLSTKRKCNISTIYGKKV